MVIGTTVRITIELSATPTDVTLDIYDCSGEKLVAGGAMTDEGSNIWAYSYQSDTKNDAGKYKAIIKVSSGPFVVIKKLLFELEEQ